MKALHDLLPLLAFLLAYYLADLYVATAVLMATISAQVLWSLARHRRVSSQLGWACVLVLALGGLTLWLRDPLFIMLKPTLVCSVLAAIMLGSQWLGRRNVVQVLLDSSISLTDAQWRKLNTAGAVQMLFSGALNLYVAYSFSEEVWVNFKVFGLTAISLVFAVGVGVWLMRTTDSQPHG